IGGWLYYVQENMRKAYLPYFSKPESAEIRAEGDSRYIKEKSLTEVAFSVWNYNVNELTKVLFEKTYAGKTTETRKAWEDWYESYVTEHYVEVPEGMEQVKRVAEEIRSTKKSFFRVESGESVNLTRLNLAYLVADWMRENTSYNLELPELPAGSDPVEYFLGTCREGYCMHYASASVMILRELGVPARYVSGYVAGDFVQDELTGKYEVSVLDSNGHAWVEIYLEGFGWIPVEVTKGYSVVPESEMILHSAPEGTPTQKPSEEGTTVKPAVTPEPTATPDSEGSQSVPPPPDDTGVQNSDTEQKEDSGGTGKTGTDKAEKKRNLEANPVVLIFVFAGLSLLSCVIMPIFRAGRRMKQTADERRLRKGMKRRGNRQKIKFLNRRLYRKLRAKGKIRKRFVWDEEYEEVLRKQCKGLTENEKNRYMQLAKAAAFSLNEFTEEEVTFCRQIYRKVLYEKETYR
ncbi:MAG: transglutaminase domain-containing protein, partial [Lachnospiraceae bacterium]